MTKSMIYVKLHGGVDNVQTFNLTGHILPSLFQKTHTYTYEGHNLNQVMSCKTMF